MKDMVLASWKDDLVGIVASELNNIAVVLRSDEILEAFAVDLYPWHGRIALALLTSDEVDSDPILRESSEISAWRHYDFMVYPEGRASLSRLAEQMKDLYLAAPDRRSVADRFFKACALALDDDSVQKALQSLQKSASFRIIVDHPDDGMAFYPPSPELPSS